MIIRPARPDEIQDLSDLCLRSKAHWPYDAVFIEACRDELTVHASDIEQHALRVAELAGRPVGVIKLVSTANSVDLDLLFVDPDYIGEGIGRALLEWGIDFARAQGFHSMTTVADPYAESFYALMGFEKTGEAPSGSIPGRTLPAMELSL